MHKLFTIGHSNHSLEKFMALLKQHSINAVCDVRSQPYSKFNPQFNRETIIEELKSQNISYVFLGKELGPRSEDPNCYIDGKVQYSLLASTENFQDGLERIKTGIKNFRIALLCAEKDPVSCHRTILICRHLRSKHFEISHILEDGTLESHRSAERRLMRTLKIPELTLFDKPEDLVEQAYDLQGEKIAYTNDEKTDGDL